MLVGRGLTVVEHRRVVLNPFRFRRAQARRLGLGRAARLAWADERRVCQAVRLRREGGRTLVVGNLHGTSYSIDRRLTDAELLRAATFVDGMASPQEPVLLCGDFNLSVRRSRTLAELMTDEWGFSGATPIGIDHVLVRGLRAGAPYAWPAERRLRDGRPPLGPHPGRAGGRMTFEEGRAHLSGARALRVSQRGHTRSARAGDARGDAGARRSTTRSRDGAGATWFEDPRAARRRSVHRSPPSSARRRSRSH